MANWLQFTKPFPPLGHCCGNCCRPPTLIREEPTNVSCHQWDEEQMQHCPSHQWRCKPLTLSQSALLDVVYYCLSY
jgi:hypothetical protein